MTKIQIMLINLKEMENPAKPQLQQQSSTPVVLPKLRRRTRMGKMKKRILLQKRNKISPPRKK
jgi:hypothetical protein